MRASVVFSRFSDLFKKNEKYVNRSGIYTNGEENDYAEKNELYVENSVTAFSCSEMFGRYLIGKGDESNYEEINDLINDFKDDYKIHRGFAALCRYNIDGELLKVEHVNFTDVRKGKEDDTGFNGKYILCKDWLSEKSKKTEILAFNPNPEIVKKQIENAGGLSKYKGQLFYFHDSKHHYPRAFIHSVINDADTEFRISLYRNKGTRNGFVGKKILVTPPMIPDELNYSDAELTSEELVKKRSIQNSWEDKQQGFENFVGAENNQGFMHLEVQYDGDDISKAINVIDIDSDMEDGTFKNNEESIRRNIRAVYFNIPPVLIDSSDGSFFGSDASQIIESEKFYEKNVSFERKRFVRGLNKLFSNMKDVKEIKLTPLIDVTDRQTDNTGV